MSQQMQISEAAKVKKERPRMKTAAQVLDALRLRYPKDQFALLAEVGNSTGFKCNRHADAIVMGLWPSRGLDIIGIEVKVSRADWKKELENPSKADIIAQYCDRWFVAVGDSEIVQEGELPSTWGLLVPKDETTLRCAKDAPQLQNVKPLDRNFVAAIMRQAQTQLTPEAEINRAFARGREEGVTVGKQSAADENRLAKDDLKRIKETVKEFEAASGVNISNGWQTAKIGEAVKMIVNGTYLNERYRLEDFRRKVADILDRCDVAIESFKPESAPVQKESV